MKITGYQIYEVSGRLIKTDALKNNVINVSNLKTGTYIISLLNEDKVIHREKIIKK